MKLNDVVFGLALLALGAAVLFGVQDDWVRSPRHIAALAVLLGSVVFCIAAADLLGFLPTAALILLLLFVCAPRGRGLCLRRPAHEFGGKDAEAAKDTQKAQKKYQELIDARAVSPIAVRVLHRRRGGGATVRSGTGSRPHEQHQHRPRPGPRQQREPRQ